MRLANLRLVPICTTALRHFTKRGHDLAVQLSIGGVPSGSSLAGSSVDNNELGLQVTKSWIDGVDPQVELISSVLVVPNQHRGLVDSIPDSCKCDVANSLVCPILRRDEAVALHSTRCPNMVVVGGKCGLVGRVRCFMIRRIGGERDVEEYEALIEPPSKFCCRYKLESYPSRTSTVFRKPQQRPSQKSKRSRTRSLLESWDRP